MSEYLPHRWLNDLLSSGEVSQDWPSSMHDHMSTPFNVSQSSDWRTAVQAFCFIFTKPFYCLQNHCKYIFMLVVNLGWAGDWSLQSYCVQWRDYRLPLLWHISLVTRGNLWPICPSQRCPRCFVSDAITVKVGCSSTRARCVLWLCWSPAKWFILHRWLVLGQIELLPLYSAVCLQACVYVCAYMLRFVFVCLNLNTSFSSGQGHFGINPGIWYI